MCGSWLPRAACIDLLAWLCQCWPPRHCARCGSHTGSHTGRPSKLKHCLQHVLAACWRRMQQSCGWTCPAPPMPPKSSTSSTCWRYELLFVCLFCACHPAPLLPPCLPGLALCYISVRHPLSPSQQGDEAAVAQVLFCHPFYLLACVAWPFVSSQYAPLSPQQQGDDAAVAQVLCRHPFYLSYRLERIVVRGEYLRAVGRLVAGSPTGWLASSGEQRGRVNAHMAGGWGAPTWRGAEWSGRMHNACRPGG